MSSTTQEGDTFYFNTETLDGSWDEPEEFNPNSNQLNKEEIQVSQKESSAVRSNGSRLLILYKEVCSVAIVSYASLYSTTCYVICKNCVIRLW